MTPPNPQPERSKPSQRRETQPRDQSEVQWQTFTALPAPEAKLGLPDQETQTQARTTSTQRTETETQTEAATESQTKVATWQKRVGAFALDFGLGLGACYLAQGAATLFGAGAESVSMIGYGTFFGAWLVNRGFLQSRPQGQSFGKWLLNIKTIDTETEQSPTVIRSMAREGVTSLFILTEALAVPLIADGLFSVFDKEKRQSIHDRAGRTQVVEAEEGFHLDEKAKQYLQELTEGDTADDVKAIAADLLEIARRNETVADITDQVSRLGKEINQNTRSMRQGTGKQVKSWVDTVKKKIDD